MSRPPSDATALRNARRLLKRETVAHAATIKAHVATIKQCDFYKVQVTKAEQEVVQWKMRFDALLLRIKPKDTPQINDTSTAEKGT